MNVAEQLPVPVCFVDSNVWIYAFLEDGQKEKRELAAVLLRREQRITLSYQVINEVCFNLLKKSAITESKIQSLIARFHQRYQVVEADRFTLTLASDLRARHQFSYWDSMIVASALSVGATICTTG